MLITPAILTDKKEEFYQRLRLAEKMGRRVQIDFMDGQFVPSVSLPVAELPVFSNIEAVAHLMVNYPQNYFHSLKEKQFRELLLHIEAEGMNAAVIAAALKLGFQVGLALNPRTPVSQLEAYQPFIIDKSIAEILILAVEPGYTGQKLKPEVLGKIKQINAWLSTLNLKQLDFPKISIDGGVKPDNLAAIKKADFNEAYIGSGLFQQKDPLKTYQHLVSEIQNAAK